MTTRVSDAPAAGPSVSVVMATYRSTSSLPDGALDASIASLAGQSLCPIEIIIIDDGSGDGTLEELHRLEARYPQLLKIYARPHSGLAQSLNFGLSVATGDYVAIADHDDVFARDRLAVSASLAERTGADMVGGQVVGGLGRWLRRATSRFPIEAEGLQDRAKRGYDLVPHITMMIRRDSIERFGGYRELERAADLELMLRWAHRGARISVSPEVLAWYRLRWEHLSVDTQTRWMLQTRYARDVSVIDDAHVPDFATWFSQQRIGPARREARRRVIRLAVVLALGTLMRRRSELDGGRNR